MIKATDYIDQLIFENEELQFIQTAEGRVVPKTVDGVGKNEYQYHLKDHLGNVRTTFAVRDDDYATGFETLENPYFDNYEELTILNNLYKKSGNYSHRLTGGGTDIVGLMKSLYVSKGDKVSAEVYGKYLDAQFTDDGINGGALVNSLVTMLGGGTITGEGTVIENNLNSDYISAAMADGSEEESPKAYLNYIMLDKNFNYVNSGFERLSESAADPGDGTGTHQKLSFEEILIEEDGYLMLFLSNESEQSVEVFWDDFMVDHHYNAVLQADDYYPFGLTFNSYQRSYSKANNFKYNGKELQEETGWYDYGARNYDAALGRFFKQDRFAEKYLDFTPYQYAANNPILFIDINGDSISVNSSLTSNEDQYNAMVEFAKTDEGKKFLANYASAGQEVFGQTFDKDGKFHSEGINVDYSAGALKSETVGGETTNNADADGNVNGSLNISVKFNTEFKGDNLQLISNAFHESFIHVDLTTKDFLSDGKVNFNTISHDAKVGASNVRNQFHHSKVRQDFGQYRYSNNNSNLFPLNAYRGLKQANNNIGAGYSSRGIIQMMWNYRGGIEMDSSGKVIKN